MQFTSAEFQKTYSSNFTGLFSEKPNMSAENIKELQNKFSQLKDVKYDDDLAMSPLLGLERGQSASQFLIGHSGQ